MRNFLNSKTSKYFFYMLLVVVFLHFGNKKFIDIEQNISVDSFCDNTNYVKTKVWVKKWYFIPVSLEKSYFRYDITESKLDSIKLADMKKAKTLASKLEMCLAK